MTVRLTKDEEAARERKLQALKVAEEKLRRFDARKRAEADAKVKAKSLALGPAVLAEMDGNKHFRSVIMELLGRRLTLPYQRKLFDLAPLPETPEEPKGSPEKANGGGDVAHHAERIGKKAQTA